MFIYNTSSDAELLEHIASSSSASVSVAKRYHKSKGNFDVVERIDKARRVLKQQRVILQLEQLNSEIKGFRE